MIYFSIDTSELTHLSFGGTAGVTTGTVFAAENGGRNLPTAVYFPFHNNITTSAFVSYFSSSTHMHSYNVIQTLCYCVLDFIYLDWY